MFSANDLPRIRFISPKNGPDPGLCSSPEEHQTKHTLSSRPKPPCYETLLFTVGDTLLKLKMEST